MFRLFCSIVSGVVVVAAVLGAFVGCNAQLDHSETKESGQGNSSIQENGNVFVSDGPITIENGKVTYGRPEVTEEAEREIYKSLSYFRNLARSIEEKVPGGNRGSRQSWDDFDMARKAFYLKYGISDAEIDSILKRGDEQEWK